MCKRLKILLFLLAFVYLAEGAFAMSPGTRFPEWNKTDIRLTDWDPARGLLTVEVTIEANRIPISKVYSQPYLQSSFNTILARYEKEGIKQGDKAVFTHRLNVKSNSDNWLEMDIRALPDLAGLKMLIRSEHANNPATLRILEAEANQIKSPIFIGGSLPILTRNDIALSVTPEIAFSPSFSFNNSNYYIWLPLNSAENQTTSSSVKLFKAAVKKKDAAQIEITGQNLINRFSSDKKSIVFKKPNGDNFTIPSKIAVEMLNADIISLKAILSNDPTELEKAYKALPSCYTKAFIAYNLAVLYKSLNKTEKSQEYLLQAIEEQPAWPLAKKLLRE